MTARRALIFDVSGTCINWRSATTREMAAVLLMVDGTTFASAWRAKYGPAMGRIREGGLGYATPSTICTVRLCTVSWRISSRPIFTILQGK